MGTGVEGAGNDDDDGTVKTIDETALGTLLLLVGGVVGCAFTSCMRSWYFRTFPFRLSGDGGRQETKISWELRLYAAVIVGAPDGAKIKTQTFSIGFKHIIIMHMQCMYRLSNINQY